MFFYHFPLPFKVVGVFEIPAFGCGVVVGFILVEAPDTLLMGAAKGFVV